MFTPRVLKKPPIREAIFTITFNESVSKTKLSAFLDTVFVREHFPITLPGLIVDISASKDNMSNISTSHDGFSLRQGGKDNKRLIQVKSTYLSFHNLNNYDGWEVMIEELKLVWSEFCNAVGKGLLSEVRVRNINNLNLPLPMEHGIHEYLTLLPIIPQGINPNLGGFFVQIHTTDDEKKLNATITEAMVGIDTTKKELNVVLDITVFKRGPFVCNEAEMWLSFDQLREFKDQLFFNIITPKTCEIYE